jgi:hypothetical protein
MTDHEFIETSDFIVQENINGTNEQHSVIK